MRRHQPGTGRFALENNFRTIIDGYNLIFQCGLEGKSRTPLSLERARGRLLSTLATHLDANQVASLAVVYDAATLPIKETAIRSVQLGITVLYAIEYEDADTLIEQMILKNSTPKRLTVVSSDHRIQKSALKRKSKPIDSDVWYERIVESGRSAADFDRDQSSAANEPGKPGLDQLKEIDWVSEFGLDVSESSANPKSGKAGEVADHPFPPGYTDDLLDE